MVLLLLSLSITADVQTGRIRLSGKRRPVLVKRTTKNEDTIEYFNHSLSQLGEKYREPYSTCDDWLIEDTYPNPSTIKVNGQDVEVGLTCENIGSDSYIVVYTPVSEIPNVIVVSFIDVIIVVSIILGIFIILLISYCCIN